MKAKLPVLFALGGLGIAGLIAVQQTLFDPAFSKDIRLVQAPATSETASGDPNTAHHGMMPDSGQNSVPPVDTPGTAVGFTLIGGKLFLVAAKTAEAVALVESTVDDSGQPSFQCDDSVANSEAVESQFSAWKLQSYGGSGPLPPMSEDGQLLTASPSSEQLPCILTNAQGIGQ